MPIVLGNGRIHLEVRSTISELDPSQRHHVPGPRCRHAQCGHRRRNAGGPDAGDCGVGANPHRGVKQRAALDQRSALLGAVFRNVEEKRNEVELLIMVTPELVEPLDASEVPPCGPGMQTTSPSDWELFMKGHLEVPKCPSPPAGLPAMGDCRRKGGNPGGPPPDGMIGPDEQVPAPPPAPPVRPAAKSLLLRQTELRRANAPAGIQNGPPGFIGPVGYDVVK